MESCVHIPDTRAPPPGLLTAPGSLSQVPLDVERRKSAKAEDGNNGIDRPLQMVCIAAMVLPLLWAGMTQESPSAREQISEWLTVSWNQLTDGKINLSFQLAVAALFIERLCYTWVHTFSASFVRFTQTAIGAPPRAQARRRERPLPVRYFPMHRRPTRVAPFMSNLLLCRQADGQEAT